MDLYQHAAQKSSEDFIDLRELRYAAPFRTVRKHFGEQWPEHERQWGSLISGENPVSSPLLSHRELTILGCLRTCHGFAQLRVAHPDIEAWYEEYHFQQTAESDRFSCDLREYKRLIQPQLKRRYGHYLGLFRPVYTNSGIQMMLGTIGWNYSPVPSGSSSRRPRATTSDLAVAAVPPRLLASKQELVAAVAFLMEPTGLPNRGPCPKALRTNIPKLTPQEREAELTCQTIRASMPFDRSIFGQGDGKRLGRNVAREAVSRAASYDLAGTSPLRHEGIAPYLATVGSLPALKLL
jgi:hypothetical protein